MSFWDFNDQKNQGNHYKLEGAWEREMLESRGDPSFKMTRISLKVMERELRRKKWGPSSTESGTGEL